MSNGSSSSEQAKRTSRSERANADGTGGKRSVSRKKLSTAAVIRRAREQFHEVTGREAESVSAFAKTDDGWELTVEVLELARIPDTTSVLGSYQVRLDADGDFVGYQRLRRYARGQIDSQ